MEEAIALRRGGHSLDLELRAIELRAKQSSIEKLVPASNPACFFDAVSKLDFQ
jgi:hypothetical protein